MQRLVRNHYDIDAHAGLQFEVSSWDVCHGKSVEVTEAAYPLLAPLLDSVSAVVVQAGKSCACCFQSSLIVMVRTQSRDAPDAICNAAAARGG